MNKLPQLTEHQIQDQIIQYLRMKGYYVQRLNAGQYEVGEGRSRRFIKGVATGTPDLMAFKKWRPLKEIPSQVELLFIEVKRPGKFATPLQMMKMEELELYGAKCIVAHDVNEVEAVINV